MGMDDCIHNNSSSDLKSHSYTWGGDLLDLARELGDELKAHERDETE